MAEKLKEIPGKILSWWNKFTNRQKTIIVALVAIVVFTAVFLTYTFTKPQYTKLGTYDNTTDAAKVIDILNDAGITHKESSDARTIEVVTSQLAQANYALAAGGYRPDVPSYGDFVDSNMSTTSTDKENQYTLFQQAQLEAMLETLSMVNSCKVKLTFPPQTYTLSSLSEQQEASAYVQLELSGPFSSTNALSMARVVASYLGNSSTANITIMDQDATLLFAGGDDYSGMSVGNMQELQAKAHALVTNRVKSVLLGTKQFDDVTVSSHLDIDFSEYQKRVTEYYAPDGMTEGMKSHEDTFSESGSNGVSGIPGTDTNGSDSIPGYYNPDNGSGEYEREERSSDYQNNVSDSVITTPSGAVNYANSSLAISMVSFREYYEQNVKDQGLLDGMSWSEFKLAHSEDVRLEVDEAFYKMAADATGISQDKITIIAYESPVFYDKEGLSISGTDILSIVMIVLILALLGFVVLRSMGPRKKPEQEEEELSVEKMLQSTPEPTVEDIDVETKSETRKMIDKFVDENPEAAANLLRNWLNEDWN